MSARLGRGDVVRVRLDDPAWHTRAPRYVRGRTGRVIDVHGVHQVPDDVVTGVNPVREEPVYAVRFTAGELWGSGDHSVTVNLWERYLMVESSL